jgi:hypothetical protein
MFRPGWPSSGVKIFLMRKLLSSVVNIYAGLFSAPLHCSWCVVFFLACSKVQQGRTQHTISKTQGTCIYINTLRTVNLNI